MTLDEVVAAAVTSLAADVGADPATITVVEAGAVQWRDGSLGCPRPGFFYTQAVVDGHRVVLDAGDGPITFHQGASAAPFRCESPQEPLPGAG